MLQRIDKVSVAYIISLFQLKIRSILPLNSDEVKMYFKNSSYKLKKASGMLLLLCSFCNMYAQLYIGKDCDLNIKDSILFLKERKDSLVSLYIKDFTTVYHPEQISNIKVVELSSLSKSQQTFFAKTVKKADSKKAAKKALKSTSEQKIYITENNSSNIISYDKSEDIAIIITNTFKEKKGVLQTKYKMFALYKNQVFPEQALKGEVYKRAFLTGIQIRPPPFFKSILY